MMQNASEIATNYEEINVSQVKESSSQTFDEALHIQQVGGGSGSNQEKELEQQEVAGCIK